MIQVDSTVPGAPLWRITIGSPAVTACSFVRGYDANVLVSGRYSDIYVSPALLFATREEAARAVALIVLSR